MAAFATLASQDVDLCLVPEVPIVLEDALPHLERRRRQKGPRRCCGGGRRRRGALGASAEKDAGGNKKLPPIGAWLTKQIKSYFKSTNREVTVKYIDPSYMVRSVPADAGDSYLCMLLAHAAAHGAMAGYTGFTVGLVKNKSVMIPIPELNADVAAVDERARPDVGARGGRDEPALRRGPEGGRLGRGAARAHDDEPGGGALSTLRRRPGGRGDGVWTRRWARRARRILSAAGGLVGVVPRRLHGMVASSYTTRPSEGLARRDDARGLLTTPRRRGLRRSFVDAALTIG